MASRIPSTDEASALVFMFENATLPHIGKQWYRYMHGDGEKDFQHPTLGVSPERYDCSPGEGIGENILWKTKKATPGVDDVVKVELLH